MYKLVYIGEDNNSYFHIFDIEFDVYEDNARILNTKFYRSDKKYLTTNFTSTNTIFTFINSVSGTYNINSNTGVLSI